MKLTRRLALAAVASPALAQPRPLRLIIPFPPGGASDLFGRLLAERMGGHLNQPVVVENRGGTGGLVAAEYAARQPADGQTLLFATQATQVFNKYLYRSLPYDPDRDFTPLSTVASVAYVLVMNPAVPATTLPGLIAYARANPGRLNYGSSGIGSGMHLATHTFAMRAGGDMVHVPYRGAAPAVTALVQGEVQLMVDLVPNSLPLVRDGRLRAMAVGLLAPTPLLPGVPTFHENGIDDFDVPPWFLLVATGQVAPEVAARLTAAADAALAEPGFAVRLEAVAAQPMRISGAALTRFLAEENARWAPLIRSAGARLD